jgi:hypothetical protein
MDDQGASDRKSDAKASNSKTAQPESNTHGRYLGR